MQKALMQVIRFPELQKKIPVSRSTIFRWERDKKFPRHIKLGNNSIGWLTHQIEEWISSKEITNDSK